MKLPCTITPEIGPDGIIPTGRMLIELDRDAIIRLSAAITGRHYNLSEKEFKELVREGLMEKLK